MVEDESQDEGQDEEEEELTDDPRYWCEAEWYPNPIADLLPGFYDNQTGGEAKLLETVEISKSSHPGVFRWTNLDKDEAWSITQDACDFGTFWVSEDCPYYDNEEDPYFLTFLELIDNDIEGVYGPGYEFLRKLVLPDTVAQLISKA